MKIAFYGDAHAGYTGDKGGVPSSEIHAEIINRIIAADCQMALYSGDFVYNVNPDPWPIFSGEVAPLRAQMPVIPARGNHDSLNRYLSYWGPSLPANGISGKTFYIEPIPKTLVIISLSVHASGEKPPNCSDYSDQVAWLDRVLAAHRRWPLKIVCWHTPPYSTGTRGSNVCARNAFNPTLAKYDVSLVVCAHNHVYERFLVNGIQYVVSAGGGGVPHEIDVAPETNTILAYRQAGVATYNYGILEITDRRSEARISGRAYDWEGNLLDQFEIVRPSIRRKGLLRVRAVLPE
jgi:hypothetical protein